MKIDGSSMKVNETSQSIFSSQPKALYVLFFVELWERFSFYGIRVLLILYMTSELGFNDIGAYGVYGMYFALVSASTVAGGYLADRYLGNRKAIYLGGIFIALGHFFLLFLSTKEHLAYGLSFIVAGTGFFKANITSLLGQYYEPNDIRRDSGFTIFYMGINIGSFLAPFICGYIGRKYGWHYGFGISGIGILIGLIVLFAKGSVLEDRGLSPNETNLNRPVFFGLSPYYLIILGTLISIPIFGWCIQNNEHMGNFLNVFGIGSLILLIGMAFKCEGDERKSMLTLILMLPFFVAFWTSFEQAGASILLFIDRHVTREIIGYTIESSWFLSLNPLFIITLGPPFAFLWIYLGKRNLEPMTPVKFSLSLLQVSLSFWFLKLGIMEGTANNMTSMFWVVCSYFFRTTGELCLSPVALSMVTKLAPQRLTSFMMGVFFLSIAFAQFMAQQVAKYFTNVASELKEVTVLQDKAISFMVFGDIFEFLMYMPLVAAIIILMISPLLRPVFEKHR